MSAGKWRVERTEVEDRPDLAWIAISPTGYGQLHASWGEALAHALAAATSESVGAS